MKATQLLKERRILNDTSFLEMVVWRVPISLAGSRHNFKYSLAFVVDDVCVLRYDNEAGKGDHKHVGKIEVYYRFTTPMQLVDDFLADVDRWRQDHEHSNH